MYYIGITSNINKRVASHRSKHNIATKRYSRIDLVHTEKYQTRKEAEKREVQIKKWTKAKKQALIEGNMDLLKELSKS